MDGALLEEQLVDRPEQPRLQVFHELQVLWSPSLYQLLHPACDFPALAIEEADVLADLALLLLHEHAALLVELVEALPDAQVDVLPVHHAAPPAYHLALLPSAMTADALLRLSVPRKVTALHLLPLRQVHLQSLQSLS